MTNNITLLNFDESLGILELSIQLDEAIDLEQCKICLVKKSEDSELYKYEEIEIPFSSNRDSILCNVNVNNFFNQKRIKNSDTWDLFILYGSQRSQLCSEKEHNFKFSLLCDNNLIRFRPYINQNKGISLIFNTVAFEAIVTSINRDKDILHLNYKVKSLNDLSKYRVYLSVKKREQHDLYQYYERYDYESKSKINNEYSTVIYISDWKSIKSSYFDLFVIVENDFSCVEFRPMINDAENGIVDEYKSLHSNPLFKIKMIIEDNKLVFDFRNEELKLALDEMKEDDDYIYFNGKLQHGPRVDFSWSYKLLIKRRMKIGSKFEYYDEVFFDDLYINGEFIQAKLNKKMLGMVRDKDIWEIFLRVDFNDETSSELDILIVKPKHSHSNRYYFSIAGKFMLSLYVNQVQAYSLYFSKLGYQVSDNTIKIAVLGSCFSRNAFNSSAYFNPDYKKYYHCVLTQFHSSIASLVSTSVDASFNSLSNMRLQNREYIKTDFKKTFFEKLLISNSDYLIIDLYADASREMIQFEDESIVSGSLLLRSSLLYRELSNYTVISHENNEDYFSIWKKGMDIFATKIVEIIPEERIILNRGRFTDKYADSDQNVVSFPNLDLIKRNNYFWDKLNNYFMYKLPKAKMIDLSDTNFIGHYNHPFGNTYSHYQTEYYREFMNRLNKIVLADLLEGRKPRINNEL